MCLYVAATDVLLDEILGSRPVLERNRMKTYRKESITYNHLKWLLKCVEVRYGEVRRHFTIKKYEIPPRGITAISWDWRGRTNYPCLTFPLTTGPVHQNQLCLSWYRIVVMDHIKSFERDVTLLYLPVINRKYSVLDAFEQRNCRLQCNSFSLRLR